MKIDRRYCSLAVVACFGAMIALLAPAHASDAIAMSPALQKVIDGAKQEGKLTLSYAANILGGPDGARVGAAGIKQMFGVDLDVTFYPGPSFAPMAAKLLTEMQAGQPSSTDVYNGTAVEVTPQLSRGLFRQVPWVELYPGRITPGIVEGDSRAMRVTTKIPGILYNTKVAPQLAQAHEMADLLKPEYKGKLYATPYLAGFDVLVAKDVWGYDKTAAFIQQYAQNIGGLAACAATDRIASGEIPGLALSCAGSEAKTDHYHGVIGEVPLLDAATRRFDYLCVPTNAAHPNAAILFTLFLASPEGQLKIMHDIYGDELDSYTETQTHQEIVKLQSEGAKFIDVTTDWWGSHPGINEDLGKLIKIVTKQ
jgi:ABC-type Fe3+ transport system substrate-binding protein